MAAYVDRVDATQIQEYLDRDDLINMLRGAPVDLRGPLVSASASINGKSIPFVLHIHTQTRQVTWNKEALLGASLKSLHTLYMDIKGVKRETQQKVEREIETPVVKKMAAIDALSAIVHDLNKSSLGPDFDLRVTNDKSIRSIVFQNLIVAYKYTDSPSSTVAYKDILREVCNSIRKALLNVDGKTHTAIVRHMTKMMAGANKC
jgi:hypothetical protein